eukprot:12634568-Alexandrium_andersonii.AAC.1
MSKASNSPTDARGAALRLHTAPPASGSAEWGCQTFAHLKLRKGPFGRDTRQIMRSRQDDCFAELPVAIPVSVSVPLCVCACEGHGQDETRRDETRRDEMCLRCCAGACGR